MENIITESFTCAYSTEVLCLCLRVFFFSFLFYFVCIHRMFTCQFNSTLVKISIQMCSWWWCFDCDMVCFHWIIYMYETGSTWWFAKLGQLLRVSTFYLFYSILVFVFSITFYMWHTAWAWHTNKNFLFIKYC